MTTADRALAVVRAAQAQAGVALALPREPSAARFRLLVNDVRVLVRSMLVAWRSRRVR